MVGTNQGVLLNWCQLHCLSANFKTHHATLFKGKDMFMVYACTAKFIQRKRDNGEPPTVSQQMGVWVCECVCVYVWVCGCVGVIGKL